MKLVISVLLFAFSFFAVHAQTNEDQLINVSGVVVDGDSIKSLPFTHVVVKSNYTGTVADSYGFFSILAHRGDTILFSRVGYSSNEFVIPDTLKDDSYSVIHLMYRETVELGEVKIYAWPSYDEFKDAFTSFESSKEEKNLGSNLENEKLTKLASNLPAEGSVTYKTEVKNRHTMMYQTHGYPTYRIFDPLAWQKFIKAWRSGDFKRK